MLTYLMLTHLCTHSRVSFSLFAISVRHKFPKLYPRESITFCLTLLEMANVIHFWEKFVLKKRPCRKTWDKYMQ